MLFSQIKHRTSECQKEQYSYKSSKLFLTTQLLFCILKTLQYLNIKSHTKLCVSTRSIKSPLFNSNGTKSVLQRGKWGRGVDYSIQFPSTSEDTTQEVLHHTFLFPNPHKLQTDWQTLLHGENSMQQQTREEQWYGKGGR